MKEVYVLTTYHFSTFSYRGVESGDVLLFASEAGARKWAADNGRIVTDRPDDEEHVTLWSAVVLP